MHRPKLPEKVKIGGVDINLRMAMVLWVVTLTLMVYRYHPIFLATWLKPLGLEELGMKAIGTAHNQFVLFFIVPILAILGMGDSPADYGLGIGRWKEGLAWLAGVCPIIFVMLLLVVPHGNLQKSYEKAYYSDKTPTIQQKVGNVRHLEQAVEPAKPLTTSEAVIRQAKMLYTTGVLLFAWEYLLRGFCLFGLARVLGPGPAIFIQMVPFALLHIGKDELEVMSTFLSGVGFGFVAWRTQSFLYAFLIHWFLLVMTILVAVYAS